MPPVTIEAVQAKQSELDQMIQQLVAQSSVREIKIEGRTIKLQPGERYAGARLDAQGQHMHDTIVLTARPASKLNWQGALDFGVQSGGQLASPEEYALIKANCPDLLTDPWCWTNREYEDDASAAWSFFSIGNTLSHRKSAAGGALAVRRV